MCERRWVRILSILFFFNFLLVLVVQDDAFARVGGGGSSGSRGSRTYSAPRAPSTPSPAQPPSGMKQASPQQPAQQPGQPIPQQPYQQPGGFMRGLGGGIMGGILGGMLFRSLGFGSDLGESGGGIGLFEILLFAALLYFAYSWFVKRRRQQVAAEGYYQRSSEAGGTNYQSPSTSGYVQPREETGDLDRGVSFIRQMDGSFDEKKFKDDCMDHFFKIQGAWANRDLSGVKKLLTDEMVKVIDDDLYRLKLDKKINKLDNIAVRSVDLVEAWQESGADFVTVKFYANLLDYTVDESTGQVISGSKTEPVKFEEYWTFTRPVGNHPWRLSAIQQVE
jgi:predicted lipid-binding transport protein (Tim44 family)